MLCLKPLRFLTGVKLTPPPPPPLQAEVVDTTIDQSQSILHIDFSQHVALMATTLGLVSALLLCLALYCILPYIARCLCNLVGQEDNLSAARYTAGAFSEGSYPLHQRRHPAPSRPDGQSRPYSTPTTALYITNQSEENISGGSRDQIPVTDKSQK